MKAEVIVVVEVESAVCDTCRSHCHARAPGHRRIHGCGYGRGHGRGLSCSLMESFLICLSPVLLSKNSIHQSFISVMTLPHLLVPRG